MNDESFKEMGHALGANRISTTIGAIVTGVDLSKPITNEPSVLRLPNQTLSVEQHVVHPVVRTHPETGLRSIHDNEGFTAGVVELTNEENAAVLQFLYRQMTRPEYVYRHR